MKSTRSFPFVTVTAKQEASVRLGHPWIYATEITKEPPNVENGSLVDIFSAKGKYLGSGLWSQRSLLRIRLLSDNANESFDEAFFVRRVNYAVDYRKDVMGDDFAACRLIHGEADGLPGVTVDKYDDILVSQITCLGTDMRKDIIYRALIEKLKETGIKVKGIFERNETALRDKEGLLRYKGWYEPYKGDVTVLTISECGLRYEIDIAEGQKTGFFLDQKYNRLAVRRLAKNKRVLDACCHTGSFGINAAMGGALSIKGFDVSPAAVSLAKRNASLNGLTVSFGEGDVFAELAKLYHEHERFDLIVLDPPAFTKSRRTISHAETAYRSINAQAMRLVGRGGYLATGSCSHFIGEEAFIKIIERAADDAGVRLKIAERRGASPDHPVLAGCEETGYLKFAIVQII